MSVNAILVRKPDQLDKYKSHKERRQEIKDTVLIGCNAEISAFLLSGQC